jgi:hypothetical protein
MFTIGTIVWRENKLQEVVTKLSKIHCLGNFISNKEIVVDPPKVEAIMEWHVPMNV